MIIKTNKESAVLLCGHGSRNTDYSKDLLRLKNKLQKKLKIVDFYHCFIEINDPGIEDIVRSVVNDYKNIYIFPLLLFEGKHMIQDIRNQINYLSKVHKKKINLLEKISLIEDILPIIGKIIMSKTLPMPKAIITSCSFSKSEQVRITLEKYTEKLSKYLYIDKNFSHFVGEENDVLKKIKHNNLERENILLHPIFLFGGFLYNKNIKILSKKLNTYHLLPLFQYEEVICAISRKLIRIF